MIKAYRHIQLTLLSAAAIFAPSAVMAAVQAIQPHENMRQIARSFLQQRVKQIKARKTVVTLGRIDPRLRLTRCSRKPEAYMPINSRLAGYTTVGIRCSGKTPWNIYLQAHIRVFRDIAVARTALVRGAVIQSRHFQLVTREVSGNPALYLTDRQNIIGKIVTRPMAAGQPLLVSNLAAARLIRRGQKVVILAKIEGLHVKMQGIALQDGSRGSTIKVRNQSSRRIVEGTVIRPGTIMVNL